MAVNAKELAALQGMWKGAKPQMDCSVPDGTYEFVIKEAQFKVTANGIPQIVTVLEIVGGNEAFIGEKFPQRDSLQTAENMGWFKKKLARLGITIPEEVEELTTRIPKEMIGKKFAGQLKTKEEFINVYVNKFLGDVDVANATESEETEETTEEAADETGLQVGATVTFVSKSGADVVGELIEVDGDNMKIKTPEGKLFKVASNRVTAAQEEATEEVAEEEVETEEEAAPVEEETAEEATTEESGGFPTPEEVKAMKLPELKKVLEENDMDITKIKNPRIFVNGLSSYMYTAKYMPDLATLFALRDGIDMKVVKNEKPADLTKRVVAELHKRFEF
jgi:hypothetical protein